MLRGVAVEGTGQRRVGQAQNSICDVITKPESLICEGHCLLPNRNAGHGEVGLAERAADKVSGRIRNC